VFLTSLLAASLAAPVPKDKPGVPYFPVTLGTKRVVERTTGTLVLVTEEEVTKVEEKDGVFTVTLTSTSVIEGGGKRLGFPATYLVTDKTVTYTFGGEILWKRLDLGVKAGESWAVESKGVGDAKVTTTYTVGKEEELEVPAGKFKAIPVTEQRAKSEKKTIRWFAAGVGVVREESESFGKAVIVLKSFTPAKDEKK
jgi:RNase P/RNase MRP subunit p29